MKSRIFTCILLGILSGYECYPATGWSSDLCSRRKVIEIQDLVGHINSLDINLKSSNDCQIWRIQAPPNQNITIRFSEFQSGSFKCNDGAYVEMGPAPEKTLCGVPKIPFIYHSTRDHVWIKFVIPENPPRYRAQFRAEFITELGTSCSERCNDGTCIYSKWRCNGYIECLDSSDEMNCRKSTSLRRIIPSTTTKKPIISTTARYGCGLFDLYCKSVYRVYACIPSNKICDGVNDCLNGGDEENCKPKRTSSSPPPTQISNPCGYEEIYCRIEGQGSIYRCLHNVHKCDGIRDCYNNEDENPVVCRNEKCDRRLEEPSGWFAPPFWRNQCSWVIHQQGSSSGSKIQLRQVYFSLQPNVAEVEYVKVYDGPDDTYPLIGRYDGLNPPPVLIESSSNWLHVVYQSVEDNKVPFNFTYQTKGVCLSGQIKCMEENDCFDMSVRCNGVWDCPISGSDELGCGRCFEADYYCGLQTGQCYHKEERCNGISRCSSKVDEINCTSVQCGSHNGTFLCDNSRCIYESWVCDQRDDCGDSSDERNCGGSTKRVIIAAISGSMICALLLVILMGCSCKLYSLRVVDHRRLPRHETPMSRLYAEFLRRRAPPPYHEAMLTSRNFDELQQEILQRARHSSNRSRRSRRSRSRNNQQSQTPQNDDTNNNSQNVDVQDENNEGGNVIVASNNTSNIELGENRNNVDVERTGSTALLIPSDSQTGSSESDDSDCTDDDDVNETNPDAQNEDHSDDENILTSESLSTRWARAAETETLSDDECILDNISESHSMDQATEPETFSSSFRDSHCDNASVDTGSLSVNSIELPEITPSTVAHDDSILQENDSIQENDSDYEKLDDGMSESSPKPETSVERSTISQQRCLSHDSLNSEGSEILSDNDVPLLPINNSSR